jgi:hypothetical protein
MVREGSERRKLCLMSIIRKIKRVDTTKTAMAMVLISDVILSNIFVSP